MDESRAAQLLANEEVRIRTVIAGLESGGVVGHSGLHEHLEEVQDRTLDGGTELAERSFQLGLLEQLEGELQKVAQSRTNLAEGRYGKCATCGVHIADERLLAMPTTEYCVKHA